MKTASLLANSDTCVSIPFTRPPEFIGAIQSISGSTITVSGTPGWVGNQFVYAGGTQSKHYYVLLGASGSANPKEGHTYAVTANGSNTLTIDTTHDDLSGIPASSRLVLIPYWTLATVFPPADANVSFTPTSSTTSYQTLIRIPDNTASGTDLPYSPVYLFSSNIDGTSNNSGWRRVGDNTTDHGDDTLLSDSYFVVRNSNGAPTLPLSTLGAVLMRKWTVPLMTSVNQAQDNPVSIIRPLNVALNGTGLGPVDGSFVANDQLLFFDNSQVAFDKAPSAVYYYDTSVGNSGGWRLSGGGVTDHGTDVIRPGTGFMVRKAATPGGQTTLWNNSFPLSAVSAVSRKVHGLAGVFDIPLPLTGAPGIECRAPGATPAGASVDYQIIFTFPAAVTFTGASVTSGTGSVANTTGSGATAVTVNLSGITNAQDITLTLVGVNDGTSTNDVAVRMGVLLGDVNANGLVNSTDISETRAQSGRPVTGSNFRADVNANGLINSTDVSIVQSKSGTGLASPP
jgi:uncharacterized protein (TIGR02597 family)